MKDFGGLDLLGTKVMSGHQGHVCLPWIAGQGSKICFSLQLDPGARVEDMNDDSPVTRAETRSKRDGCQGTTGQSLHGTASMAQRQMA